MRREREEKARWRDGWIRYGPARRHRQRDARCESLLPTHGDFINYIEISGALRRRRRYYCARAPPIDQHQKLNIGVTVCVALRIAPPASLHSLLFLQTILWNIPASWLKDKFIHSLDQRQLDRRFFSRMRASLLTAKLLK